MCFTIWLYNSCTGLVCLFFTEDAIRCPCTKTHHKMTLSSSESPSPLSLSAEAEMSDGGSSSWAHDVFTLKSPICKFPKYSLASLFFRLRLINIHVMSGVLGRSPGIAWAVVGFHQYLCQGNLCQSRLGERVSQGPKKQIQITWWCQDCFTSPVASCWHCLYLLFFLWKYL